ncbi:hypothetical protein [Aneurinibacillus aneurinilyticus]|uniref:Uncharacterized protein n=1 Tax=Aneurinibacillus aneurinilyticus ATCC 12856 TaxID=649747 RepID=U1Y4U8_ANEAE|nr:hypothetical protein [Aneurinibacillus aneurinilyticus]ERI07187.1 hypothetical protein HMPREF0083_04761 [Aneurinibacillus aneurinilyticus ATCC 12856]MED0705274.1 hypothetical protein [Aneurinibacillus aneurinilyticus]MED0722478.1 hypothetical protein [Aneurinibacillus aneurinilyticus]MED0733788.1 hypothetical protein [Aneurinibacillus aneurinilyticus]MED0739691.1 hypothetical protein [Aneurinibacillus aneurinilyticus]
MRHHLHYIPLHEINHETVKLKELNQLIRQESEIDSTVVENFPLTNFGLEHDDLNIKGAKALLEAFYKIDNEKIDLVYEFGNVKYLGLTKDRQIMFQFDEISASGIYNFTSQFYSLFHLGKYAKWLIEHNHEDLLGENLKKLLEKNKGMKKQFRFIKDGLTEYLRGFTSTTYKNYDNNLCIYLVLLALHQHSVNHNVDFRIEKAHLSDSAFQIFFEQQKPISIEGLGDIYFGACATNNEIRDKQFSFEIRYKIIDPKNPNLYFSAMAQLKDSVFDIKKNYGLDTIKMRFNNIRNLKELQDSMIFYIRELKNIKTLTKDELTPLYSKITSSRNFTEETKKNMKDLYDKNLVKNTYTILQALNKVNSITTDLDELQNLERIYNEFIAELVESMEK